MTGSPPFTPEQEARIREIVADAILSASPHITEAVAASVARALAGQPRL